MAKFYVQCGTLRNVVDSNDVEAAALWVIHKAMSQILPLCDEPGTTTSEKSESLAESGPLVLGEKIIVSEQGFDRNDAMILDTFEAVAQWNQLLVALDRLQKLL